MYAWGGSTADWKKPGSYKYDSARSPYLDKLATDASAKGPRTYAKRTTPDMKLVDPRGKTISSDSANPIIVGVDVTGSMSAWPGEIFDRLPLMYQTLSQYRPDVELCFAAIGDANSDQYPLQVNNFGKGLDLEEHVRALCPEGGGGGQISESYELFAYFVQNRCNIPNAKNPFLVIFGDEKFYNKVDPKQVAHYIGDKVTGTIDSDQVFKKLMQKFNVFYLQKEYGYGGDGGVNKDIADHWAGAIGDQHIIKVPSAERAVDVAIGLIAKNWGEYGDFKKNLSSRQDEADQNSVYQSLRYVPDKTSTESVVIGRPTSMKSKSLDDQDK